MRVPVSWLSELVDLPAGTTVEDLDTAFVRLGLEVEEVHRAPETTGPLVVGRVLEIEELTGFKKPIRFCQVDVGEEAPRGIVCGARNFAVGDTVVVALPGAVLPGGFEIASRKTYDRLSDGMICSVRELGLGEEHAGILVLGGEGADVPPPGRITTTRSPTTKLVAPQTTTCGSGRPTSTRQNRIGFLKPVSSSISSTRPTSRSPATVAARSTTPSTSMPRRTSASSSSVAVTPAGSSTYSRSQDSRTRTITPRLRTRG